MGVPVCPLTQHHGAATSPDVAEHEQPRVGECGRAAEQHGIVCGRALPPRRAACRAGRRWPGRWASGAREVLPVLSSMLEKGTGHVRYRSGWPHQEGESCLLPARGAAGVAAQVCSSHPVFLFRAVSLQLLRY